MSAATGFSLLELIIVVALVAILAGFGVLGHHAMRPGLNLMMATRQVVMDLKVSRMHAVAKNATYRVVFAADTYQREHKQGTRYTADGPPTSLPAGITIAGCTAAGAAVSFKPRGNAGSFGTITLRNEQGTIRQVVVDIAGQVRVQ